MSVARMPSGGKDSCFNLLHCLANGHEIVAVAHLAPADERQGDTGPGGHEAVLQLLGGHLDGHHQRWPGRLGAGDGQVASQERLTAARPGGDGDQLAGAQAVKEEIELDEASGDSPGVGVGPGLHDLGPFREGLSEALSTPAVAGEGQ